MRQAGSRSILLLHVYLASGLTAAAQIPLGPPFAGAPASREEMAEEVAGLFELLQYER